MHELEEASKNGWIITTKEVQELIGVKPTTRKGENYYQRGCWLFTKAGKIGIQTVWLIAQKILNQTLTNN